MGILVLAVLYQSNVEIHITSVSSGNDKHTCVSGALHRLLSSRAVVVDAAGDSLLQGILEISIATLATQTPSASASCNRSSSEVQSRTPSDLHGCLPNQ